MPPRDLTTHRMTGQPSKDADRVLTGQCKRRPASHVDARHAMRRAKTFKRAPFLKRHFFQNIEDFFEAAAAC